MIAESIREMRVEMEPVHPFRLTNILNASITISNSEAEFARDYEGHEDSQTESILNIKHIYEKVKNNM